MTTTLKLVLPANAYRPNWQDKRVTKRIKTVLQWCDQHLSERIEKQVHHATLNEAFGQQQNQLSAYLRRVLLIQQGQYQPGVASFKYLLNGEGYRKVCEAIGYDQTAQQQNDLERLRTQYAAELQSGDFEYHRASDRDWHPLQNISRKDKQTFWTPYLPYDYDFSACAPSILSQSAHAAGLPDLLQGEVLEYLQDPSAMRQHVATLAGCSLDDAKRLVNSLFNGARLQRSKECAAYRTLQFDYEAMTRLMEDPQVKRLQRSIRLVWRFIGIKTGFHLKTGRHKWGLYFACERQVMDVVTAYLTRHGIRYFTEHDGFRTDKPVNVDELLAEVKAKTGFDLKLKMSMP